MVNPDKVIPKFITSRKDAPTGSKRKYFDGDESTRSLQNAEFIVEDDYIGVEYNKVIDIDSIRFPSRRRKDHFEHAKLQYMTEEGTWEDLTLTGMENNFAGEFGKVQDINVKEANLPSDLKQKESAPLRQRQMQMTAGGTG